MRTKRAGGAKRAGGPFDPINYRALRCCLYFLRYADRLLELECLPPLQQSLISSRRLSHDDGSSEYVVPSETLYPQMESITDFGVRRKSMPQ